MCFQSEANADTGIIKTIRPNRLYNFKINQPLKYIFQIQNYQMQGFFKIGNIFEKVVNMENEIRI